MEDLEFNIEQGRDGLYAVMFFNHSGYKETKIKEDFNIFGDIASFRLLESGVGFVRYAQYCEAVKCVREMSSNPNYFAKPPDGKKHQRRVDWSLNRRGRLLRGRDSASNAQPNYHFGKSQNFSEFTVNTHDEPPQLVDANETSNHSINSSSSQPDNNGFLPYLKPYVNVLWEKELGQLPEVTAIEVIVANLPPGIFQSELFELCANGEPLHIDVHFTGKNFVVHYASVFVKSTKHAHNLITELNGQYLENNKLIVALGSTILDEYYQSCDNPKDF